MFKSLWFRLSASFTALIFIALCLQSLLPIYLLEAAETQLNFFPKVIEETVVGEELILAQTIREPESKA